MKCKRKTNKVEEVTINKNNEDIKKEIDEYEERYKNSFKGNSCKEILETYNAYINAKKRYYGTQSTQYDVYNNECDHGDDDNT